MAEPMEPIAISDDAADRIRGMAALEGCTPQEIVRRGLLYLDNHLQLEREGYKGPIYQRHRAVRGFFSRIFRGTETIRVTFVQERPPDPEA